MKNTVKTRSRVRQKSHARFCSRVREGNPSGLGNQVRNTGEIMERAVQYLAEILTLNCRKLTEKEKEAGQRQTYKYPKVIGIWIMGENVTDRKDAVNEACVAFPPTERDKYQIITDKLRIFFVELQKFHPKHIDRKNMLDVWMAFLKNPLNDDIQDVPEVKEALDTLKEISADKDEREIYYLRQHTEFGYISEKNVAVAQALEKGKKLEREKAKAEKVESAKKMLSKGLSIEDISDFTGLSLEEVKKL